MKKSLILIPLIGLILLSTQSSNGQRNNFSGRWTLNRTKSLIASDQLSMSGITIKVKADSLLITRIYERSDGQQFPFDERVTLDSKEYNFYIYDMPRKAKAAWSDKDNTIIFESTTTYTGNSGTADIIIKEIWKHDKSTNTLIIDFKNIFPEKETTGTFFFNRSPE
jgi:hypothetical protein